MTDKQQAWLLYLNTKLPLGKTLEVKYVNKQKPVPLPQISLFPIGHRVILPFEIVLETDRPDWRENFVFGKVISEALKELGIPYILGYSGNKSLHFHIFLNPNVKIKEKRAHTLKEQKFEFWMARNKLAEKLFGFIKGLEIAVFGNSKLDYATLYRNHTIREFGGYHEETGLYKTSLETIPEVRPEIKEYKDVSFPSQIEFWNCNEDLEKVVQFWRPRQKKKVYAQVFSK